MKLSKLTPIDFQKSYDAKIKNGLLITLPFVGRILTKNVMMIGDIMQIKVTDIILCLITNELFRSETLYLHIAQTYRLATNNTDNKLDIRHASKGVRL